MLTKQEIFDRSTVFLLKQGKAAKDPVGNRCFYRHPDNPDIRCAVGCLIPDHLYRPEMDGAGAVGAVLDVMTLFDNFPEEMKSAGFDKEQHLMLLMSLQNAHDGVLGTSEDIEQWLEELKIIANKHDLNADILATAQLSN